MFRQMVGDGNMWHCCPVTTKRSQQPEALSSTSDPMQYMDPVYSAVDMIRPFTKYSRFLMKLMMEYNLEGKDLYKVK